MAIESTAQDERKAHVIAQLNKSLYKWLSSQFMDGCTNYNSAEIRRSCRSKEQARAMFAQENVPHAKGQIFFNPVHAFRFAKTHGYPLVIKPNVSGFSRGSYFPIQNKRELIKALFKVKMWWPTTVVEQYLQGKNYRVLVGNGEILSVLERFPPHVIGDGKLSIAELAEIENACRQKMGLMPVIHPINIDDACIKYLKKQGLTPSSIPEAGQRVDLFYRIALAPGGTVNTLNIDKIPQKNQKLFLDVLEMFDANILGIDVIFEQSIEQDFDTQKCIFLEVNSRPYVKMHAFPRHGEAMDLEATFAPFEDIEITERDVL